jgi:hypothetical protein
MSYVTNVAIMARHFDWTLDDQLINFTHEREGEALPVGFKRVDKFAGGGKVYEAELWAAAVNFLNDRYRDDLFIILKGKATDCYLYEQCEDYPARIFHLESFGWKRISEDLCD